MMRRRRPLLRGALVGGAGYMAGRSVARHQQAEADQDADTADVQEQQQPPPAPAPAAAPAGGGSVVDELSRLGELKNQGLISDAEFTAAKAKLLGT
jgi:hypothetical protein